MTIIVNRHDLVRQPTNAFRLNPEWVKHGVEAAITPYGELITTRGVEQLVAYGNVRQLAPSKSGLSGKFDGSAAAYRRLTSLLGNSPEEFSIVAIASLNSAAYGTIFSESNSGDSVPFFWVGYHSSYGWLLQFRGDGTSIAVISGTVSTDLNREYLVGAVFRSGTGSKQLWVDDAFTASSTTDIGSVTLNQCEVGVFQRTSPGQYFDGKIPFLCIAKKAWGAELFQKLRANPWQIFEPREEPASFSAATAAQVAGNQSGAAAQSGNIAANILAAGIQLGVAAQSGSIAGAPSPAGTQSGAGAQSLSLSNASTVGGTVSAIATQSGDLFVRAEVGGAQLAAALQSLALSYGSSVGGIMAGDAAHTLDLGFGLTIGGTQIAAAIQAGGIAPDVRIAGVQIGSAAQSMGLAGDAATIGGTQAADASQSLVLTTVVRVTGEQIANAILSGSLTVDVRIGSVQGGVAQIVGDVSGAVRISATMAGAAAQSGAIQLAGELIIRWPARRLYSQQIQATRRPRQLQGRR